MIDKIPLIWVIAGGSFCFAFGLSAIQTPGMWLFAGTGLTLALASTAHYIVDLVRVAVKNEAASPGDSVPPLI